MSENVILLTCETNLLKMPQNTSKPLTVPMQWSSSYRYGHFQKHDTCVCRLAPLTIRKRYSVIKLYLRTTSVTLAFGSQKLESVNYTNWTAAGTLAVEN